jgi:hypothetical protein
MKGTLRVDTDGGRRLMQIPIHMLSPLRTSALLEEVRSGPVIRRL